MSAQGESQDLPQIRVSDAERERAHGLLKAAALDGRLTLDEFSQRVEGVEVARTRDQIQAAVGDLAGASPIAASPKPTVAVLSSVERTGHWRVGETSRATAVVGSCKLDLCRAAISGPVTTIDVRIVMGSMDVIVPEGVEVELEATTVMGSRTARLDGTPGPGAPIVRITGFVVMGSVTVRSSRSTQRFDRLTGAIHPRQP